MSYIPGSFDEGPSGEPFGRDLWAYLVSRSEPMMKKSNQNRPAAEAVAYELPIVFKGRRFNDEIKRMAGRMIRQIMEGHGYWLDEGRRKDIPETKNGLKSLFKQGSMYKKS